MTPQVQRYLRFCAVAVGATLVLLVLGFEPTRRMAGDGGPAAMVAGALIALLGSLTGGLAVLTNRAAGPASALTALKVMGVRLVVVLIPAVVIFGLGLFAIGPFLVWLALSHITSMIGDTRYLIGAVAPRK